MTASIEEIYSGAPRDRTDWIRKLELQMTIGGEDAPSSLKGDLTEPCSGGHLASYQDADASHVESAVAAASRAFKSWSQNDIDKRREAISALGHAIGQAHDELSVLLACETGRPLRVAQGEVTNTIEFLSALTNIELPQPSYTLPGMAISSGYRPLGVAAAIAPWNAPLILGLVKVANALIAGDTAVLRPSPFTPLTALYVGMIAREILPPGVFNVITGDVGVASALTIHPSVAKISFTGSTATGRLIAEATASQLKPLTLELGGNDAAIALPDADVGAFADTIVAVSLANAGHYCSAAKRIYVHDDIYDEVREAIVDRANRLVVGDNFDPQTTMTPVQNRQQFDRIWSLIDETCASKARLVTGGRRSEGDGLFIEPTIFEDLTPDSRLICEEQFGPVIPLIRFGKDDDVAALANESEFGLGGSIWSRDTEKAHKLAVKLETGTAWINQHGRYHASVPLPSAKQSGLGTDYAHFGIAAHARLMVINESIR